MTTFPTVGTVLHYHQVNDNPYYTFDRFLYVEDVTFHSENNILNCIVFHVIQLEANDTNTDWVMEAFTNHEWTLIAKSCEVVEIH